MDYNLMYISNANNKITISVYQIIMLNTLDTSSLNQPIKFFKRKLSFIYKILGTILIYCQMSAPPFQIQ